MALADPQSITVNGSAKIMPLIVRNGQTTMYQTAAQDFKFTVSHVDIKRDKKSRVKSLVTFTQTAAVTDPITSVVDSDNLVVSFQIDRPLFGFDSTTTNNLVQGLNSWLTSTNVGKLFGRES